MGGAAHSRVRPNNNEPRRACNTKKRRSNNENNSSKIHHVESTNRIGINSSCRAVSGTGRTARRMRSNQTLITTTNNNNNESSAVTPSSSNSNRRDKRETVVLTQKLINQYLETYQITHRGVVRKDARIQNWIKQVPLELDESNNPANQHTLLMSSIEPSPNASPTSRPETQKDNSESHLEEEFHDKTTMKFTSY